MKKTILSGLFLMLPSSLAFAQADKDVRTTTETTTTSNRKVKTDAAAVNPDADNTGVNKRDQKSTEVTADQQKNSKSDVDLTAQIRRSVLKDKALSVNAHNVKIIAQDGTVTLKGVVHSAAEKTEVEHKAAEIAGEPNVKSELQIKP